MQYFAYGDLRNHIGSGLQECDAKQIAIQVLEGLQTMHHLDIIHRDIKPAVSQFIGKRSRQTTYFEPRTSLWLENGRHGGSKLVISASAKVQ